MHDPHAPDFRRGFLRVPLGFWLEAYCKSPLTRREMQVISAVLRESWGWSGKDGTPIPWTRPLPTRRIAGLTGLSTDRLKRDLEGLVERGALRRWGDRYQVVPDPGAWKPRMPTSRAHGQPSYPQAREGGTPNRRSLTPKPPEGAAETALPAEADRQRKEIIKKRLEREAGLSTAMTSVPESEEGPEVSGTGELDQVASETGEGSGNRETGSEDTSVNGR